MHPDAPGKDHMTIDDLNFLRHWLQGAPLFDDHDDDRHRVEQDHLMDVAFAHIYLLHTILSIAALELFDKDPNNGQYYTAAVEHNVIALRLAKPHIANADPKHSEALFMFSALTSLFAFAEPPLRRLACVSSLNESDAVDDLLNAVRMGKGNRAILHAHASQLEKAGLPDAGRWEVDKRASLEIPREPSCQEELLHEVIDAHVDGVSQAKSCHEAVTSLFSTHSTLSAHSPRHSSAYRIMTWLVDLDPTFMDMCEARDPVALIIMSHYATVIDLRRRIWFFTRWPKILLDRTRAALGNDWSTYAKWPLSRLNTYDDSIERI
jgi:hypothetical protein